MKGIVHILFALLLVTIISACGNATSGSTASTSSVRGMLEKTALDQLYNSKYSLASPGGLCDSVRDVKLTNIKYGTVAISRPNSDKAVRIPAIIAQHDFVCVNRMMGLSEHQNDQWVTLSYDKEFDVYRCIRTGTKDMAMAVAKDCAFKEGQAE